MNKTFHRIKERIKKCVEEYNDRVMKKFIQLDVYV